MRILRAIGFAWLFVLAASAHTAAQTAETPYGSAKFATYPDIGEIKQLKVVWDFNFSDPKAVGTVFNFVNALLSATSEFGPHEIDPIKVVIVSHGPELVVFARKNYAKYKDIADGPQSLPSKASSSKSVSERRLSWASLRRTCMVSSHWSRRPLFAGLLASQRLHAQCGGRDDANHAAQRLEQRRHK